MDSQLRIITPDKNYASQIAQLEKLCFAHPRSEGSLTSDFTNGSLFAGCVDESGMMLGYASADVVLDEAYIVNVCVHPEHRRQGIGAAVMKYLCDLCRQKDFSFVTLEVRKSNIAAIQMYNKLGFECVGFRKNFYTHPNEDADIMTLYFKK